MVMGPHPLNPDWQNEQQGAAANLGFFGDNPHPQPGNQHQNIVGQQNQQQHLADQDDDNQPMDVDEADNEWSAWNPAIFAAGNAQGIPQHPDFPQDHIDLELSGSSMCFLRGDGSDLSMEQNFEEITAAEDSSSSSDATSNTMEEKARFIAAQKRCASILIIDRKGLPADVFSRGSSSSKPPTSIMIENSALLSTLPGSQRTGWEIIPWKPILDVIALQMWPHVIARKAKTAVEKESAPVMILGDTQEWYDQGPNVSSPTEFKFQIEDLQPSPVREAFQPRHRGRRSHMSLPAHPGSSSTPLTESSVRRSSRFSKTKDGFRFVRLEREPSKKRKTYATVLIDEATGKTGPIPIYILQSWGIDCGVPPVELTHDALMQAPSTEPVTNEDSST